MKRLEFQYGLIRSLAFRPEMRLSLTPFARPAYYKAQMMDGILIYFYRLLVTEKNPTIKAVKILVLIFTL